MDYKHWQMCPEFCREQVCHREQMRYTGGPRRFERHYTKAQCGRLGRYGGYCWQHRKDK